MIRRPGTLVLYALCVAVLSATAARSQQTPVTLTVDATEVARKIIHAAESIPAAPGSLTLVYPKWIPGEHGPTGPVVDMAGLKITANGTALPWRRDLENMYAIRVDVPANAVQLDVAFDFLLPPQQGGFSSGSSSSARLAVISWNQVVLYPEQMKPADITVNAALTVPDGWKIGTALETKTRKGDTIQFEPVSLSMLIDSPVLTGAHVRRIDLTPTNGVPHTIDLAGDSEEALEMTQEQVKGYKRLVLEALALFGAHHYNHYDFLFTLSDHVAHFGLEHHQSSDNRLGERTLIDPDERRTSVTLLCHEYVHSWNGKYRRPEGLATGDFSTPMKGDLLWVYEGLTQYLGKLLAVRSGLRTEADFRDDLAEVAAYLDHRPGRTWRPLQDAADEAQILYETRSDWDSWRRRVDFYDESVLIWLEVDVIIRQQTKGKKSLDDFCRAFHSGQNTGPVTKPYSFEDVVNTLNSVASYDWSSLLTKRLRSLNPHAPLDGLEESGWNVVYRDTPNSLEQTSESVSKSFDLRYSLGLTMRDDGSVIDVVPNGPAAQAGLAPGMSVIAVNGRKYTKDILHEGIVAAGNSSTPIELLAMSDDFVRTYSVDYHGGERYPYLERNASKPDILGKIIRPIVR